MAEQNKEVGMTAGELIDSMKNEPRAKWDPVCCDSDNEYADTKLFDQENDAHLITVGELVQALTKVPQGLLVHFLTKADLDCPGGPDFGRAVRAIAWCPKLAEERDAYVGSGVNIFLHDIG